MKTFGLIGFPLAQSFSYKYFTEKFEKEEIDARFLNFEIPSIKELPELLNHHPYIAGLAVTIPYKEQILPYLDAFDETAQRIKAVNSVKITWKNKKPILKGYNTDLLGFRNSIKPLLKEHHTKALILGTGGAAKAVAHALDMMGIEHKFVSRKATADTILNYSELNKDIYNQYTIIINSTPLGMYPNIEQYPDINYSLLGAKHLLFDLTYNPDVTSFMKNGAQYGAVTKNGLDMLYKQAEASWKIWNDL